MSHNKIEPQVLKYTRSICAGVGLASAKTIPDSARMTHRIFQLPVGPIQTNCYLVADEVSKAAVLIDPGGDAPRLLNILTDHKWHLRYMLLTHAHFDHIGAVAEVKEATQATLAIHSLELPLLRQQGGAAAFGLHIRPCPEPDRLLEAGQVIEVRSLHLTVLFVPGHTVGHVAFYEPTLQAVFSGDVLFQDGIGRVDFPGGDYVPIGPILSHLIRDIGFTLYDKRGVQNVTGLRQALTASGDYATRQVAPTYE